jgi:hypothetical protein
MLLIAVVGGLAGCRAPTADRSFVVPASRYAEAFDAARDELRRAGYTLERLDAANGEILTEPRTVAGLATPFEAESTSAGQVWQDTLNAQPRTVRVRFRDADSDAGAPPSPPPADGFVEAEVEVVLWRIRRPGWRLETESIIESSLWRDPLWPERGVRPGMMVPLRRDDALAAKLTHRIASRVQPEGPVGVTP